MAKKKQIQVQPSLESLLNKLGSSIGKNIDISSIPVELNTDQIDTISENLAPEMVKGLLQGITLELKSIFKQIIKTNLSDMFSGEPIFNPEPTGVKEAVQPDLGYWFKKQALSLEKITAILINSKDENVRDESNDADTDTKENIRSTKIDSPKKLTFSSVADEISEALKTYTAKKLGITWLKEKKEKAEQNFYRSILTTVGLRKKQETKSESINDSVKKDLNNTAQDGYSEKLSENQSSNSIFKNISSDILSIKESNNELAENSSSQTNSESTLLDKVLSDSSKPINLESEIEDDRRMEKQNGILEDIKKNTERILLNTGSKDKDSILGSATEGLAQALVTKIPGVGKVLGAVAGGGLISKFIPTIFKGKSVAPVLEDGVKSVAKPGLLGKAAKGLKGGIAGILGGVALDYATDELKSSGHEKLAAGTDIASSALSGAGTGAMIGSVIPGVGTVIGGAVGGIIGGAKGLWDNWNSLSGNEQPINQNANELQTNEILTNQTTNKADTIYIESQNVIQKEKDELAAQTIANSSSNIQSNNINNISNNSTQNIFNSPIRNPDSAINRYFDRQFA
jgi:hypothetical protein